MVIPQIIGWVSEKLDRQNAAATDDKKAGDGSAEINDRPKSVLHRFPPSFVV
jgi:hypothetical protein